jgi:hypothetical protein
MQNDFLIRSLSIEDFSEIMNKNDEELSINSAKWLVADSEPGYPCRVSLSDAKVGENVLALPFCHHNVNSPYRASGPIFIREHAENSELKTNEIPKMLRLRLLSVRGYDAEGMMLAAEVTQGTELEFSISNQFDNECVQYIHIHNANPGCFNCAVYRA